LIVLSDTLSVTNTASFFVVPASFKEWARTNAPVQLSVDDPSPLFGAVIHLVGSYRSTTAILTLAV
jgi:hypothetical protein